MEVASVRRSVKFPPETIVYRLGQVEDAVTSIDGKVDTLILEQGKMTQALALLLEED